MNGILNIYKEPGWTSFDVVAKLRRILKEKKIGHTGTLDPAAEGVLPVCVGKATKLCELLTDGTKTYEAVLLLGTTTDTQDLTGQVLRTCPVDCTEEEVRNCTASFLGEREQVPPMYSALKVGGKRLYELARQGQVVERKARKVTFFELTVLETALPRVKIRVTCSKGTYIRTLCADIGEALGCGGCMEKLVRTASGGFDIGKAKKLAEIEMLVQGGRLEEILLPVDAVFADLPAAAAMPEGDKALHNGNAVPADLCRPLQTGSGNTPGELPVYDPDSPSVLSDGQRVRLYDSRRFFIGIYVFQTAQNRFKPLKIFWDNEILQQSARHQTE